MLLHQRTQMRLHLVAHVLHGHFDTPELRQTLRHRFGARDERLSELCLVAVQICSKHVESVCLGRKEQVSMPPERYLHRNKDPGTTHRTKPAKQERKKKPKRGDNKLCADQPYRRLQRVGSFTRTVGIS